MRSKPQKTVHQVLIQDLDSDSQFKAVQSGQKLSPSRLMTLEKQSESRPNDVLLHLKLLGFYWQRELKGSGPSLSRFKIVLWLIKNLPELDATLQDYIGLEEFPDRLWMLAADAWRDQLEIREGNAQVLFNAAAHFFKRDFSFAESLIIKAELLEPENGLYPFTLCTKAFERMNQASTDELRRMFAHTILSQGQRAIRCDLPFHQAAWTCCSQIAEAALVLEDFELAKQYAEKAPIKDPYAEPDPQRFRDFMLAVIALKTGNPLEAKRLLMEMDAGYRVSIWSVGLAYELLNAGQDVCVATFLSQYLQTEIPTLEAASWLNDVKHGLVP